MAPSVAYVPVVHSPRRPPAARGGSSGSPRCPMDPHAACRVNSVLGRSAQGPSVPKGVMVTTTNEGFLRPEDTGVGRFVADEDVRRGKQIARGHLGRDRFEVLRYSKSAPDPQWRNGSPSDGSTLTTSAARNRQQFRAVGAGNLGRAVHHADAVEHQRAPRRIAVEQGVQATGRRMKD